MIDLMKNNRYVFLKRIYHNYIILFRKNNKLISYSIDKELLDFLNFKNLKLLNKLKINYLVIENLTILEKESFEKNNYELYIKQLELIKIVRYLIYKNKD